MLLGTLPLARHPLSLWGPPPLAMKSRGSQTMARFWTSGHQGLTFFRPGSAARTRQTRSPEHRWCVVLFYLFGELGSFTAKQATPHVAGAVAYLLALEGNATPAEIDAKLKAYCLRDKLTCYKIVSEYKQRMHQGTNCVMYSWMCTMPSSAMDSTSSNERSVLREVESI